MIGLGLSDSAASRVVVSGGLPVAVSYLPHRSARPIGLAMITGLLPGKQIVRICAGYV